MHSGLVVVFSRDDLAFMGFHFEFQVQELSAAALLFDALTLLFNNKKSSRSYYRKRNSKHK